MQVIRRLWKSKQLQLLKAQPFFMNNNNNPFLFDFASPSHSHSQCRKYQLERVETGTGGEYRCSTVAQDQYPKYQLAPPTPSPLLWSEPIDSSDEAELIYFRIYEFIDNNDVVMPPADWLWSMVKRCRTYYHIKLLLALLQYQGLLKKNDTHLSQEITRACIRCGALHYGQMTLQAINEYGFTPNIESARLFLNYAKDQDDVKLMAETFHLITANNLPLDPDTAEIILRICHNVNNWRLLSKYSTKFISAGVKLHQSSFEILMEFAAKIGDVDSLRKFETARSEIMNEHTCRSGFAYAKGLLLDGKPEEAAEVIIKILRQYLPVVDDSRFMTVLSFKLMDWPNDLLVYYRKAGEPWPEELMIEVEKLVKEWPTKFINLRKQSKKRQEYAATLKSCIPKMVNYLSTNGLKLKLDLKHLNQLGK